MILPEKGQQYSTAEVDTPYSYKYLCGTDLHCCALWFQGCNV